ncbi:hypothetical protein CPAR01_12364 [Colletotrichum paranaense]|uniref:Uncharacterized protein n=1 Tax=Colletotrichum paranaense TaxID=1914294 RepID=A0ABQ9S667_9PEZI|nr:uncharacterized protein CPAR01_12364 [Colletotrichum paranaense]KAK1527806.1 hypothetical protein CPAR01_12364 [Colletotrichum paranaense]
MPSFFHIHSELGVSLQCVILLHQNIVSLARGLLAGGFSVCIIPHEKLEVIADKQMGFTYDGSTLHFLDLGCVVDIGDETLLTDDGPACSKNSICYFVHMAGDAAAAGEIEYGRDFQISVFGRHVGKVGLVLFDDLVTILLDSTRNIESHVKSRNLSKRHSEIGPSALVAVLEKDSDQV